MDRFNVIVHDPTGTIMKLRANEAIPEFCDVIGNNLSSTDADKKLFEYQKQQEKMMELNNEREMLFKEWRHLADVVEYGLQTAGASILQNPYSVTNKQVDEWKSNVKVHHQILNKKILVLWNRTNQYLNKVKR